MDNSYDLLISYQKEEILKTENLLKQFKCHILTQNQALKMFIEDEKRLKKEKKIILNNKNVYRSRNSDFDNSKIRTERENKNRIDDSGAFKSRTGRINVTRNDDSDDTEIRTERVNRHNNSDDSEIRRERFQRNRNDDSDDFEIRTRRDYRNRNDYSDDSESRNERVYKNRNEDSDDSSIRTERVYRNRSYNSEDSQISINRLDILKSTTDNIKKNKDRFKERSRKDSPTGKSDSNRTSVNLCIDDFEKIIIPEIKNRMVHAILIHLKMIFIGGSKGMLIKHYHEKTLVYETDPTENILQIEITKHGDRISLYAFSSKSIWVYDDIYSRKPFCCISKKGIGQVYNDGSSIYIPLDNGHIERMDKIGFHIKPFTELGRGFVHSLFVSQKTFLICENSLLYSADKTNKALDNIKEVEGFSELKKIMRISESMFLFYSDHTIWIVQSLKSRLSDIGTIKVTAKIKIVQVCGEFVGVVDTKDNLYIYKIPETKPRKVLLRSDRLITALSMSKTEILVCVGDEILIMKDYDFCK